jgi:hypothetical protein
LQKEDSGIKNFIHIDARTHSSIASLDRVYDEMTMQKEGVQQHEDKEQDLLELLDSIM